MCMYDSIISGQNKWTKKEKKELKEWRGFLEETLSSSDSVANKIQLITAKYMKLVNWDI